MASKSFQAPNGTQDSYPIDLARRRWLIEHWRRVSTRHGFEEIDGPTFEHLDVYKTKSGEGIVSELFSFRRAGGKDDYALRPEFTPTLARMYAAKANALPKPTKWFCTGNFFRAERPQRGRRREFWQWNADVIGLDVDPQQMNAEGAEKDAEIAEATARMDAEVIACVVGLMQAVGLKPEDVKVRFNHREAIADWLQEQGVEEESHTAVMAILDAAKKMKPEDFVTAVSAFGLKGDGLSVALKGPQHLKDDGYPDIWIVHAATKRVHRSLGAARVLPWVEFDASIVRGLAYYTGTVFEVIADGERAVAGGGRYDGLIEMFGGPPTPAVGFGMGDVVLTNLLSDKGLLPSDDELMQWAGQTPDVFVIAAGDDAAEAARPACAQLRSHGLHARHSYKSTKNVGKLLKEANQLGAHAALLIEDGGQSAKIKHLKSDGGESEPMPIEQALAQLADEFRPVDAPPSKQR